MNRRSFIIAIIVLFSLSVLAAGVKLVSAQAPQPEVNLAPEVTLGQPGLSYRYTELMGTTGEPYIVDHDHLNFPVGLAIGPSNNIFIFEDRGKRLQEFDSAGNYLLAIGIPGVSQTGDYSFVSPQDGVIDADNNLWVVDNSRIVKYGSNGSFMMQFPSNNYWQTGTGNDQFNDPDGIAFDALGRMYISDSNNHRVQIYTIDINGNPVWVKTLGQTEVSGQDNDHFKYPQRIAIGNNQLFVADAENHRIQVFDVSSSDPANIAYVATIGVSGVAGNDNDHLDYPLGVAVNSDYILVSEGNNNRVQVFQISNRQYITTMATFGTQPGGIWNPHDVAFDSSGNIYIADSYNHLVQFFVKGSGATWTYSRKIGTTNIPYVTDSHHFYKPRVAIDPNNNILVLEEDGQRLLKLTPNGTLVFQIGTAGIEYDPNRGTADNSHFLYPHAVATDKIGNVYVADHCRVQKYSPTGNYMSTLGGTCGTGVYQFNWATGVAVDNNGNIYVADWPNHRVMIYNSSNTYIGQIGATGDCSTANDRLCNPIGVAVDTLGNIFVADGSNLRVLKFNSSWQWQMTIGTGVAGDQFDQFSWPEDVAVDGQGKIFISDWSNNRVQVYDPTGKYLTTIGGAWGTNTSQLKNAPGVDIDSYGNLYVADWENARILKFAPGVPGWKQVNINGFGDRQAQAAAMEVFNGQLYAGTGNWSTGSLIYRTSDGLTWTQAKVLGFNGSVLDMTVFNGQLYASTGWGSDNSAARIYRTSEGTTWEEVASDGFGVTENTTMDNLAVFQNKLYAAVSNSTTGASIWRSDTGNAGSWSAVLTNGNGDAKNILISFMAEFNGYLYAGALNEVSGTRIWRTSNGTNWSQVNANGFGDASNTETITMAVYKGNLYLGVNNTVNSHQIWRTSNGTDWVKVVANGFGDPNRSWLLGFQVFEDRLYATSSNGSITGTEVWVTSDGLNWSQANIDGFGDSNNDFVLRGNATAVFKNSLFIGVDNNANGGEIWQMLRQVYLPYVVQRDQRTLLFSDDFSNSGSGWYVYPGYVGYAAGEYQIIFPSGSIPVYSAPFPAISVDNYSVEADVRKISGGGSEFGLLFDFFSIGPKLYQFDIDPDTQTYYLRGNFADLAYGSSTYINPGSSVNHLKVERIGALIKIYVNGHLLASVTDSASLHGKAGVTGWGPFTGSVEVRFDNFAVYQLP